MIPVCPLKLSDCASAYRSWLGGEFSMVQASSPRVQILSVSRPTWMCLTGSWPMRTTRSSTFPSRYPDHLQFVQPLPTSNSLYLSEVSVTTLNQDGRSKYTLCLPQVTQLPTQLDQDISYSSWKGSLWNWYVILVTRMHNESDLS